ncbi:hypothetical protein CHS0354_033077 [Potamilus streckersoni]|uniref:Uncharacterized protein n=1 Tax=Potamilus streckersoni TaxID=2493646 RepID=A0AAE0TAF7_9BIVA|nr:hypothetical protein CHS0354_033077 [Potamilus streckersoni]
MEKLRCISRVEMTSSSRCAGKLALVTVEERGIGLGTDEALHKHGAKVIALSKNEENMLNLRKDYSEITTVPVNVGDWKATKDAIECLSTSAIQMLTEVPACELGPQRIRVNGINPGTVNTDMLKMYGEEGISLITERTPLGRIGKDSETVNGILYLLSDESSYENGHSLVIDGFVIKS